MTRRLRRSLSRLIALAFFLLLATSHLAAERPANRTEPAASSPLDQLDFLTGAPWVAEQSYPDEGTFQTRVQAEWLFGRRLLSIRTDTLSSWDEGTFQQAYFAWDPARAVITFWTVSAKGALHVGEAEADGRSITLTYEVRTLGGTTQHRDEIDCTDRDRCIWQVFSFQEGNWRRQYRSQFERKP